MTLSTSIKEKFFAVMDRNHIGLVDYPSFLSTVQSISVGKSGKNEMNDNFDWENQIIE